MVTHDMSKARQETAVGEGLALGCVALGRDSFSGDKSSIEFAFRHAWRRWPYRTQFPAVRADVQRDSLLGIIARSPRRRSAKLAGWAGEWPFVPFVAADWTAADVAEINANECGVPFQGWKDLAGMFLQHLDNR